MKCPNRTTGYANVGSYSPFLTVVIHSGDPKVTSKSNFLSTVALRYVGGGHCVTACLSIIDAHGYRDYECAVASTVISGTEFISQKHK